MSKLQKPFIISSNCRLSTVAVETVHKRIEIIPVCIASYRHLKIFFCEILTNTLQLPGFCAALVRAVLVVEGHDSVRVALMLGCRLNID